MDGRHPTTTTTTNNSNTPQAQHTHLVHSAASVLITKSPPNDLPPVLSPLSRHVVRRDSARPIDDGWKL
jgi:hypothetical protein